MLNYSNNIYNKFICPRVIVTKRALILLYFFIEFFNFGFSLNYRLFVIRTSFDVTLCWICSLIILIICIKRIVGVKRVERIRKT